MRTDPHKDVQREKQAKVNLFYFIFRKRKKLGSTNSWDFCLGDCKILNDRNFYWPC